jgi:hypothetical protein
MTRVSGRASRERSRYAILVLALPFAGCTCQGSGRDAAPTASARGNAGPEGWALGPLPDRGALTLPPPCQLEEAPWRGMLPGRTELHAAPDLLGELFVESGPLGRANAGVLRMELGQAESTPWPTLDGAAGALAMGPPWMRVGTRGEAGVSWVQRGPNATAETLTQGERLRVADARCTDGHCAVLLGGAAPGESGGGTVAFVGAATEAVGQWRRIELSTSVLGRRHATIARVEADAAVIALDVDRRVEWQRVGKDAPRTLVGVEADGPVVASALGADDTAWLATPLADAAAPSRGGIRLRNDRHPGLELHAPTPPTRGWIHALPFGAVVWWLGPRATGGAQQLLHGVMITGGRSAGPIAIVAEADDVAFAAHGDRIDVWVTDDGTITYGRLRCATQAPPSPLPKAPPT